MVKSARGVATALCIFQLGFIWGTLEFQLPCLSVYVSDEEKTARLSEMLCFVLFLSLHAMWSMFLYCFVSKWCNEGWGV